MKYSSFADMSREDLSHIAFMQGLGFEVDFHHLDKRYERTVPENPPHNAVSFIKGNFHVWFTGKFWQTAKLIDGYYCDHKPIENLKDISSI